MDRGGNWSWQGRGKRGLEFPDGQDVEEAPEDRMRVGF
jgi:hypothetical protein